MLSSETQSKTLIYIFENDGSWNDYHDAEAFLKFISPYSGEMLDSSAFKVLERELPFYNDVRLLQVSKRGESDWGYTFFIENGYEYTQLKGLREVIMETNETGVLNLSEENVHDYLKFYLIFSNDQNGENSRVIEGQNSEFLSGLSPYDQSRFLRKSSGVNITKNEKLSLYTVQTRIWSENNIYDAVYDVAFNGVVTPKQVNLVGAV
ncbi:MAG: hypothetical protein ACTHOO_10285 [Alcanivorax sp.]